MKIHYFSTLIASLVMLAGCTQATGLELPPGNNVTDQTSAVPDADPTKAPAQEPAPEPTAASVAEESASGSAAADTQDFEQTIEPIEVTYFTPAQAEGPYYPVEKPVERDSDLVQLAGATAQPLGEILEFAGKLYDAAGLPVAGAVVEIWQTDSNGIYLHPGDPQTAQRDLNFQFYGESTTATDGSYGFRTVLPGQYEPRPRHIHVKVKLDGQELLTTQFYFASDDSRLADSLFASAGPDAEAMIMNVSAGVDDEGNPILTGQRDVILSVAVPSAE